MLIGKELDVANLKDHVESQASTGFLQNVGGFKLGRGEGRNEALVGKACKRSDEIWVVPQSVSKNYYSS